jgi:uncharacterized membrane protein
VLLKATQMNKNWTDPETLSARFSFDDSDMGIYAHGSSPGYLARRNNQPNVGEVERTASAVLGGALTLAGLSLLTKRHPIFGMLFGAAGGLLAYRGATGHCALYEKLGVRPQDATDHSAPWNRDIVIQKSLAINRDPHDLYQYWRNLQNLPGLVPFVEQVDLIDERTARCTAAGHDQQFVWQTTITADHPDEYIAWASTEDSDLDTVGSIRFTPAAGGRGTLLRLEMSYRPAAGAIGAAVAKVLGRDPAQSVEDGLWRFKCLFEAGEIPATAGQPRGACYYGA